MLSGKAGHEVEMVANLEIANGGKNVAVRPLLLRRTSQDMRHLAELAGTGNGTAQ
jgi:hypothetical protein